MGRNKKELTEIKINMNFEVEMNPEQEETVQKYLNKWASKYEEILKAMIINPDGICANKDYSNPDLERSLVEAQVGGPDFEATGDRLCPHGYEFGTDHDADEDCDFCEVRSECGAEWSKVAAKKRLKKAKKNKTIFKKRNFQDKSGPMTTCSGPKDGEEYCDCILHDDSNLLPCLHLRTGGDFCTALNKTKGGSI